MSNPEKALPLHIEWNEDKTQVEGFIGEELIIRLNLYGGEWTVPFEAGAPITSTTYIDDVAMKKPKAIFLLSKIKGQTIAAADAVCPIGISQEENCS